MQKYSYIVINCLDKTMNEHHGVIEANNIPEAIFKLVSRGLVVRELRIAQPEDINLDKLQKFRNKLSPTVMEEPVVEVAAPKNRHHLRFSLLVVLIIIGGILLWKKLV